MKRSIQNTAGEVELCERALRAYHRRFGKDAAAPVAMRATVFGGGGGSVQLAEAYHQLAEYEIIPRRDGSVKLRYMEPFAV